MSGTNTRKLRAMAGASGILAAAIGICLSSMPSLAAQGAVRAPSPAAAVGPGSQWLPWAADELQEPALLQSQNGVLDVLMIAHTSTVAAFSPFTTTGWTYQICPRPAKGDVCPRGSASANEYGGSRLQVDPGDTLKIRLVNELPFFTIPKDPDAGRNPGGMSTMGMGENARSQNPTSLHTHGLLVSPHYALGTGIWGDNAFARVFNPVNGPAAPFEHQMGPVLNGHIDYEYDIPTTHPAGLFWFHPHPHGLVQAQLTSGMSGVLTIGHVADEMCVDAICRNQVAQVPERHLLLKDSQVNSDNTISVDQDTGFCAVDNSIVGSDDPNHQGGCIGQPNSPVSGFDHTGGRWFYTINGQEYPTITVGMPTGQFWRITNASANTTYDLNLWLPAENRNMEMQVISLDGVNVGTSGRGVTEATTCHSPFGAGGGICTTRLHIMPAMRAEIWVAYRDANGNAVSQPNPVQAIFRTPGYETGPTGDNYPAIDLANVNIQTGQVAMSGDGSVSTRAKQTYKVPFPDAFTASTLPATKTCAPLAPGHTRRIYLNAIDTKTSPFGIGYEELDEHGNTVRGSFVDVRPFDHQNVPLCVSLQPGNQPEVEKWQLVNLAEEDHSFHLHQVRFSVVSAPAVDGTIPPKRIGARPSLVDSIALPHADGECDSVADWKRGACTAHVATIEIPFTIAGEYVFHCHVLEHEDGGMMAGIRVLENDSTASASKAR